jgi:rod shape-determining protein MreD
MIETSDIVFARAQNYFWLAAVYIYLLILAGLNLAALPLFAMAAIKPAFLLMGIYFVYLTKPELVPLPILFVVGVVFDLVAGEIVGLSAFLFLMIALSIHAQRRFLSGQGWLVIWAGFCVANCLSSTVSYLLHAVVAQSVPSFLPFLTAILVGGLLYPLVVWPLHVFLRRLHIAKRHHP